MFLQMTRIEQQKLTRRRMFWIELGLLIFVVMAMFGLIYYARYALENGLTNDDGGLVVEGGDATDFEAMLMWPDGILGSLAAVRNFGGFLMIVLVGAIVAQEYAWRSLSLWLSRGVPRWLFLLAKFTAVTFTAILMTLTAVLIGTIISGIFGMSILDALPFADVNWGMVGLSILTTAFGMLPYAAFAFFLAVISRSVIVAIGGGLAFITLIEPLARQLLPILGEKWANATQYFPASLADTIGMVDNQINASASVLTVPDGMMGVETAVIITALYIVVFISLSLLTFRQQDLGG